MVKSVAIACQGGGSHTAFTAGALQRILEEEDKKFEITALSGTSGGAVCAILAWYGLVNNKIENGDKEKGKKEAIRLLNGFWDEVCADTPWRACMNTYMVGAYRGHLFPFSPPISPYKCFDLFWYDLPQLVQDNFRSNLEKYVDFAKIKEYFNEGHLKSNSIPELIIGTTDVRSGGFKVFRSTKDAITADMILASAAEPNFFKAVHINGRMYWDGLFARNPPVADILEGKEAEEKPDEIWVIQIDPQECRSDPKSFNAIEDRRNELSGNISLEYELHFIRALNHLIEKHFKTESVGRYKRIKLRQIKISAYHRGLDYASKWNLNPEFLDDLKDYGNRKAKKEILEKFRN